MMEIKTGEYKGEVEVQTASKFIEGLKNGKIPEEAADAVGVPLPKLLTRDLVKAELEDLQNYFIEKADTRKKVVIAEMIKVLLTADPRDKVAAAKVLTSDPDLGFNQGAPAVQVNILTDETRELDPGDLWGEKK